MSRARASPITTAAWGAVVASAAAVVRTAIVHGPLAIWGWIGYLDFVLPAVAGFVGGGLLGLLLRGRRREGAAERPVRGRLIAALAIEVALLAAFYVTIERCDPTRLAERPSPKGPRPPDIVVFIYDAVRADVVIDDHGEIPDWAPRLKELAAGGVHFRDAVSTAPWTVPSHASLFTGLSPLDHGAIEESPHLADEFETLAETLGKHGYRTVGIVANPWLDKKNGFSQGFENWFELWHLDDLSLVPLFWRLIGRFERMGWCDVGDPRSDKGARWMNAFARRTLTHLRPDEPLFLFINLVDGHPPYSAPKSDRLRFVPADLSAKGIDPDQVSQDMPAIYTGKVKMGPDEQRMLRALNLGEVAYMDHHLGALLDDLGAAGRFHDSLFALTADHGSGLGEDRLLGSGFDLREEMLRIPMVVHLPGGRDAGKKRDDLVYLHDLHPTILELAMGPSDAAEVVPAADRPDARNGRSLLTSAPRTGGLAAYSRPVNLMAHLHASDPKFDTSALDRKMLALRGVRWKYIWSSAGKEWLYDLTARGEREDLGPQLPDEKKMEESLLHTIVGGDFEVVCRRSLEAALSRWTSTEGLDPESLEKLKKLGYAVSTQGPRKEDSEKK